MSNKHYSEEIPFIRQPSRLDKAETALTELIDFTLAVAAICTEHGLFDHDHLFKMESIIKDARRKLGGSFTIEEGMKAVRAAYRIELSKERGETDPK